MRILIYNWKDIKNPHVGGAEIITFEYARRLVAEGHQVTWFCRMFPGCQLEEVIDGVKVIRRGNTLLTYWYGYLYYRKALVKPDLVIDMLNTISWQTPLYARQSRVVQYVNQLAKEVWDYNISPPLSWIGKFLERFQLLTYRRTPVVTYAASTARDLVAWGYDKTKIHLFRLGLDHRRYQPGKKADYPLFIQVCRMVRMKRPDLTVRAFAEVVKKYPKAKLALVGTGPYRVAVDRLIDKLGIRQHVLVPEKDIWFFKEHQGDQKVKLMQQAWCQVHPSVKEGWGMVITEAAACGTPSIATAVTGQVDAVLDGKTGILVSANPSVDELADAMIKIIEDQPLRESMSKACLKWASEFNWETSFLLFKKAVSQAASIDFVAAKPISREKLPHIFVVTPIYNAAKILPAYFAGLAQTTYPKEKIEIIMPDGGSSDTSRKVASDSGAIVLDNPLKTGEAGKAVGIKYVLAKTKHQKPSKLDSVICLLDSDNIIVDPDWFEKMSEPFIDDREVIGSEPWEYILRDHDPVITRYTALIGASDPLTIFLGNYDRLNSLTGRWTDLPIRTSDQGHYLKWKVNPRVVPTLGANGAIFRTSFFSSVDLLDFIFDIDLLYEYTLTHSAKFAKVKVGVVHLYARTTEDFVRKQNRRIKDFHYFHSIGLRKYPWNTVNRRGLIGFVVSCLTVLPLFGQTALGFARRPDIAWLFHPLACWITLWIYGTNAIANKFRQPTLADRSNWSQG